MSYGLPAPKLLAFSILAVLSICCEKKIGTPNSRGSSNRMPVHEATELFYDEALSLNEWLAVVTRDAGKTLNNDQAGALINSMLQGISYLEAIEAPDESYNISSKSRTAEYLRNIFGDELDQYHDGKQISLKLLKPELMMWSPSALNQEDYPDV